MGGLPIFFGCASAWREFEELLGRVGEEGGSTQAMPRSRKEGGKNSNQPHLGLPNSKPHHLLQTTLPLLRRPPPTTTTRSRTFLLPSIFLLSIPNLSNFQLASAAPIDFCPSITLRFLFSLRKTTTRQHVLHLSRSFHPPAAVAAAGSEARGQLVRQPGRPSPDWSEVSYINPQSCTRGGTTTTTAKPAPTFRSASPRTTASATPYTYTNMAEPMT